MTVDGCGYKFNEKTYVPKPGFPRDERKHAQYHYALVTLKAVFLLLACGADVCRFRTSDRFTFIANHLMQVCVRPWIRTERFHDLSEIHNFSLEKTNMFTPSA